MKILVLNGSPRKKGNTAALVAAFKEGAESKDNEVEVIPVGNLKIAGCIGCEYCHTRGEGKCVQQDDMQSVYPKLASADMVVFASPVYYFAFTGQMQNAITRFYAPWSPAAKKYALILSSGSPDVYDAIKTQYLGFLSFIKAQDCGITVGRPLMEPLKEKGPDGVKEVLETMTGQLQVMMYRTASRDLKHIDPSVIWERWARQGCAG